MAAWAVIADVEAHTGATADTAMTEALAASLAWCNRQRPDLNPDVVQDAAVKRAVVIYAGILWREKASPQGFATYEETGGDLDPSSAMMNVYRLLGTRRPVAR